METLLQDVRYGLRMLRKNIGFTLVSVITLGLGIGANTTIFSTVNVMLLRPFAFPNLDRIVAVWETLPQQGEQYVSPSPANLRDWSEQSQSFDGLAAGRGWDVNLNGAGIAQRVEAYQVSENFFSLLGLGPQQGRFIGAADFEQGTAPVVVFSQGFWQRHLGADPTIVGKSVLLNGRRFTVVGVTGSDFDFPAGMEAWVPLDLSETEKADRASHSVHVIGRLKVGVPIAQAQAELQNIAGRLAQQYPTSNAGHSVRVTGLVDDLTVGSKQFISVLMGAAFFVLLLACANVANLQLARATTREKEISLRVALGASRWQIVRQLLVESLLAAALGGAAGLLLARWGLELSRSSISPFILQHIPGLKNLAVDSRALGFTLVIALLAGIISGFAPALHASRADINEVLKEGVRGGSSSTGRRRLRALLVVSEISMALVLLVGAGLMVKGFGNLINTEMGFDRGHVLTFHIALPETQYRDQEHIRGYYDQVIRKLQALPGVESAACVTSLPSGWSWSRSEYNAEGLPPAGPGELRRAGSQSVTPEFFKTLRVSLIKGRLLSEQDGAKAPPVMVISEGMARHLWPGQDPLGKHVKLGKESASEPWRTVVGVVGDVKPSAFDREAEPTTYVPFAQMPRASSALVVRTTGDPLALASAASAQVRSVDPDQPAYDVRTLEQIISDDLSGIQFSARTMMVFAFTALILAAAGIFAVMAYSVAQRTHEIGVRMALGAQNGDVLQMVVGYAIKMAVAGLTIGLVCALAMTYALSRFLFGVVRMDVVTFVLYTGLLAAVAILAAYIPARRAAGVDPMVALRYE